MGRVQSIEAMSAGILLGINGIVYMLVGVIKSFSDKPLKPNETSAPQWMQMGILWFIVFLLYTQP